MDSLFKAVAFRSSRIVSRGLPRATAMAAAIYAGVALVAIVVGGLGIVPPSSLCLPLNASCSPAEQAIIGLLSFLIATSGMMLANVASHSEELGRVRSAVLDDRPRVVQDYENVYNLANEVIANAVGSGFDREILVMDVEITRQINYPLREPPQKPAWHRRFDEEIVKKTRQGWTVRRFWYVTTEQKLQERLSQIEKTRVDPQGAHEAGIWIGDDAPPAVELVVAGKTDLLLGLYSRHGGTDDSGALHIQSASAVEVARAHFNLLWEDPRCTILHVGKAVDPAVREGLMRKVRGDLNPVAKSTAYGDI